MVVLSYDVMGDAGLVKETDTARTAMAKGPLFRSRMTGDKWFYSIHFRIFCSVKAQKVLIERERVYLGP